MKMKWRICLLILVILGICGCAAMAEELTLYALAYDAENDRSDYNPLVSVSESDKTNTVISRDGCLWFKVENVKPDTIYSYEVSGISKAGESVTHWGYFYTSSDAYYSSEGEYAEHFYVPFVSNTVGKAVGPFSIKITGGGDELHTEISIIAANRNNDIIASLYDHGRISNPSFIMLRPANQQIVFNDLPEGASVYMDKRWPLNFRISVYCIDTEEQQECPWTARLIDCESGECVAERKDVINPASGETVSLYTEFKWNNRMKADKEYELQFSFNGTTASRRFRLTDDNSPADICVYPWENGSAYVGAEGYYLSLYAREANVESNGSQQVEKIVHAESGEVVAEYSAIRMFSSKKSNGFVGGGLTIDSNFKSGEYIYSSSIDGCEDSVSFYLININDPDFEAHVAAAQEKEKMKVWQEMGYATYSKAVLEQLPSIGGTNIEKSAAEQKIKDMAKGVSPVEDCEVMDFALGLGVTDEGAMVFWAPVVAEDGSVSLCVIVENVDAASQTVISQPEQISGILYAMLNEKDYLVLPDAGAYAELKKGSKGTAVKQLQQALIDLGHLSGKADGNYGNMTLNAVSSYQEAAGLEVTGVADSITQKSLFDALNPRTKLLAWMEEHSEADK